MKHKFNFFNRCMVMLVAMLTIGVGSVWGQSYTYKDFSTSFKKGTTSGTTIASQVTTSNLNDIVSSNDLFKEVSEVSNVYYNKSGCGLRISKSKGAGSVTFALTDGLQDSTIYAIVVYASKVSGNTSATCVVTPAGGYTTATSYTNSQLTAYSAEFSGSNYKLDTIKVGGKKLTSITFESASGGYTHLHKVTLVTQTPKATVTQYNVTENLTNVTATGTHPTKIAATAEDLTLNFAAASGYSLPATITVQMGSTTLVDNDTYTWNNSTGELWITGAFTGDIAITIAGVPAAQCQNSITITKGTESNGTFTLDKSGEVCIDEGNATVTVSNITPASIYYKLASVTSIGEGSAGVGTVSGPVEGVYTVSDINANTTITANFAPIDNYTITLNAGSGSVTADGWTLSEGVYKKTSNQAITLPSASPSDACAAQGWTFVGWSKDNAVDAITAPTLVEVGTTTPAASTTYYAVYRASSVSNQFSIFTDAANLTTGDYMVVSNGSYSSYAMGNSVTDSRMTETSKSPSSGVITNSEGAYIWTLIKLNDKVAFYNAAANKYLSITSEGVVSVDGGAQFFSYTYDTSNSRWEFTCPLDITNKSLIYYSYFKAGSSQSTSIYLYKRGTAAADVWKTNPNCTSLTLTAVADVAAGGNVYTSGSSFQEGDVAYATYTKNDGYNFTGWTVSGTGAVLDASNPLLVKVTIGSANVTLTAGFAEIQKSTVSFNVGSGNAVNPIQETTAGGGITLPAGSITCEGGWQFAGWVENAYVSETTTKPTLLLAGSTYYPTSDCALYAVYKVTEGDEPVVVLSEEFDNSTTSDSNTAINSETFANFSGNTDRAYKSKYGGIKFGGSSAVGYITSKSLDLSKAFTVTMKAAWYGTSGDGGDVVVTVGSATDTIHSTELTAANKNFELSFEAATNSSTIKIGTTSKRAYIDSVVVTVGNGTTTYNSTPFCCTQWESPTVTYSSPIAVGDAAVSPTISGTIPGTATASYESSNTAVLTVNSSTGAVTAEGAGTAYVIVTWTDDTYCTKVVNSNTITVTGNISVAFDAKGGEGTMDNQVMPANTSTKLNKCTFTKTGYSFQGWDTNQSGETVVYADTAVVTFSQGCTLYAVWQLNNYDVTFTPNDNGNTITVNGESTSPQSVAYGSIVTIVATPKDTHFTLTALTYQVGSETPVDILTDKTFSMPAGAVTVSATFNEDSKRNVTLHIGSETSTVADVYDGTLFSAIKPTPDPLGTAAGDCADTFVGWATSSITGTTDKAGYDTIKVTAETAVSKSQTDFYAVFATGSDGGTKWVKTAASAVTAGTYAIITTDGHAFNGSISSGHGQVTSTAFSFTNNEATSAPEGTLEVTLASSGSGYTMYSAGKGYLYASAASSGKLAWHDTENNYWSYSSSNWTYNSNSAYLRSYNNSSIRTYSTNNGDVLQFAKKEQIVTYSNYVTTCCTKHNITLTNGGSKQGTDSVIGTFTADPMSACENTEITLAANPKKGYTFTGWTTSPEQTISGNKFEMPAEAVTVDATFALQKHNVILHKNDGVSPEATDTTLFTYGTPQNLKTLETLKWSAPSGHNFGGWATTASGTGVYEDGYLYTLTAEQDVDLYASWVEESLRSISYTQVDHLTYGTNPETISKDAKGFVVAYTVDAHYQVTSATVTVNGVTLTEGVTVGQNGLTVEKNGFEGPVVVTPTVAPITYNVIWSANGSQFATNTVQQGSKPTLPDSEPTSCGTGIVFMGWTDNTIDDQATAPAVLFKDAAAAPTVETAAENTVTFYAVYAERSGSGAMVDVALDSAKYDTWTISGTTSDKDTYRLMGNDSYAETTTTFDLGKITKVVVYGGTFGGDKYNDILISDGTTTWKDTEVEAGKKETYQNTYTVETNPLSGTGKLRVTSKSGDGSNNGVRLSKFIAYTQAKDYTYAHYSTSCIAPLNAPVIQTEAGNACGDINVTITQEGNPEGTKIYYTTDATAAPVAWTEYTEAIKITAPSTTTITAKTSYLTKNSDNVSKTFTALKQYADLASAVPDTVGGAKTGCFTFQVLVNAAASRDIYVQDAAGNAYVVYSNSLDHGIKAGDTLKANGVQTSFTKLNNTIKVTYTSGIETVTPASSVTTPTVKTIANITAADFGKLIKIESVHVDSVNETTFKFYYDGGTDTIAANRTFMPSSKWRNTAWYDVTGIILLDAKNNPTIAPRNNNDMQSKAEALSAPTGLSVTNITGASAKLSWSEVAHAQKYTVVVKKNGTKEKESTTTNVYYTPSGLTAGTAYTWTVKAIGDKLSYNDSPESEAGSFTTLKAATIKWMVNGSEYETTTADNEKAVLPKNNPTNESCAELYSDFICWVNRPVEGVQTRAPYNYELVTDTTKAKSAVSGGDTTYVFYALFGKVNTPASYDLVESELADWRGQYLIAYSDSKFMDGSKNGGKDYVGDGYVNPSDSLSGKKVLAAWGDLHYLTIEAVNDKDLTQGYVLKTNYTGENATPYIYRSSNSNGMDATANKSTACNNPLTITYQSSSDFRIISSAGPTLHFNTDGYFRFYKDAAQKPVYVYRYGAPTYSSYITSCPSTYSVTIDDQVVGGTITADPMTNVEAGAKVTVTAEPSAGYTTGTWKVTDSESQPVTVQNGQFTMPTSNVTVSYTFTELVDQFVDNLHGNDTIRKSGAGYTLPTLEDATEGTLCDKYYVFAGWIAGSYNSGEPADNDDEVLTGAQNATGTTYHALWWDYNKYFITECCNTAIPTNFRSLSTYLKATSAKLQWNVVTNATKYRVYVTDSASYELDQEQTDYTLPLVGLSPNTNYYATVKAYVGCWGFNCDTIKFTTASEVKSYSVTINSDNGTYSIDPALQSGKIEEGATVTISDIAPADADHYFKDLTITPEVADLIEVDGSYMFTMPGNAITIDISFPAIPVITWKVEGTTTETTKAVQTSGTTNFTIGTMQAAPTDWSYKEDFYKDFAGWLIGTDVDKPVFASAGTAVTENITLNAAFAKSAEVDFENLVKITSYESLDFGAKYVIGASQGDAQNTMWYFSWYNMEEKNPWGHVVKADSTLKPLKFTISGDADSIAIQDEYGKYLNYDGKIKMSDTPDKLQLSTDDAKKGNIIYINQYLTEYDFRLNYNGGSGGLRWYASTGATGTPAYLYKASMLYDYLTIAPTEQLKKRVINVEEYSTICLEQGAKKEDIFGLSLWTIEKATWNDTKLYSITIVQHEGDMVAGVPYIVCGEESENDLHAIAVSGDAVDEPIDDNTNGLHGKFVKTALPANEGYYVISNGTLYLCGNNSGINDHRAYIKADEITDQSAQSAPAAVRRTIGGKDTPALLENIFGNGDTIQKMIIDNQFIIIRGGRIYNASGALVK